MNKQKIIRTIRECANKLKRNPTVYELEKAGIPFGRVRTHFKNMTAALKAAGLEPIGFGYQTELAAIMLDWAAVTRKLGKMPTEREYALTGKYTYKPFMRRFGRWNAVPGKFVQFARQQGISTQWQDVLKAIRKKRSKNKISRDRSGLHSDRSSLSSRAELDASSGVLNSGTVKLVWNAQRGGPRLQLAPNSGRAIYGAPLPMQGMIHEPTNEDGVICLFGMVAAKLGLLIRRVQSEFPDCEVLCEVEPRRWICLLIEFEFESRNFERHGHPISGCDMIVCWVHNWSRCPKNLQVLELSRLVKEL